MARPRDARVESYAEVRLRHELAKAEAVEMDNAIRRGEFVRADEVREVILRCVTAANARLGAVPVKWAPILRPDDPVAARRHLELAVEEGRAELRRLETERAADAAA